MVVLLLLLPAAGGGGGGWVHVWSQCLCFALSWRALNYVRQCLLLETNHQSHVEARLARIRRRGCCSRHSAQLPLSAEGYLLMHPCTQTYSAAGFVSSYFLIGRTRIFTTKYRSFLNKKRQNNPDRRTLLSSPTLNQLGDFSYT